MYQKDVYACFFNNVQFYIISAGQRCPRRIHVNCRAVEAEICDRPLLLLIQPERRHDAVNRLVLPRSAGRISASGIHQIVVLLNVHSI